jgi:hypothetical protein
MAGLYHLASIRLSWTRGEITHGHFEVRAVTLRA